MLVRFLDGDRIARACRFGNTPPMQFGTNRRPEAWETTFSGARRTRRRAVFLARGVWPGECGGVIVPRWR